MAKRWGSEVAVVAAVPREKTRVEIGFSLDPRLSQIQGDSSYDQSKTSMTFEQRHAII